jgi:hypothetical protein
LQQPNVLLTAQRAGVVFVDHLHTGAGVACQGQQVYALAIEQPKSDGRMPEAVEDARLAMGAQLEAVKKRGVTSL